jgi:hypothetical protein
LVSEQDPKQDETNAIESTTSPVPAITQAGDRESCLTMDAEHAQAFPDENIFIAAHFVCNFGLKPQAGFPESHREKLLVISNLMVGRQGHSAMIFSTFLQLQFDLI